MPNTRDLLKYINSYNKKEFTTTELADYMLKIGVIRKRYFHSERSRLYLRLRNLSIYGFVAKKKVNKRMIHWALNSRT